jgi:hypothetical protein
MSASHGAINPALSKAFDEMSPRRVKPDETFRANYGEVVEP